MTGLAWLFLAVALLAILGLVVAPYVLCAVPEPEDEHGR